MNEIPPKKKYESEKTCPTSIQGYISVAGAATIFGSKTAECPASTKPFQGKKADRAEVGKQLIKAGFTIICESPLGFSVSAPAAAFEELSGARVKLFEVLSEIKCESPLYVTRMDLVGKQQPKTLGLGLPRSKTLKIDGIVLEKPRESHSQAAPDRHPSVFPPHSSKFHLTVPNGVATALNVNPVHRSGNQGDGVRVTMIDSGFYKHPFFTAQHYNLKPNKAVVPETNPADDPVGHGTGESANIFACAPGVEFQGIRTTNAEGKIVGCLSGFVLAKNSTPKPQIITCSWGSAYQYPPSQGLDPADQALVLEIKHALEQGIVVIFAAGNGQFNFEPQVPGVIAAGGVFLSRTGVLRASNFTSGYKSPWFGGVTVPTVCGLVGLLPRAQYIMLPVQPGCHLDRHERTKRHKEIGDGTHHQDGWALFSGSSAAAPQIAGVAALILAANPNLTPAQVREAMVMTATDVTWGRCHPNFGHKAKQGHDLATGAGLVNATAAIKYVSDYFS